jgi:ribosomal-protein-alanine N-acetyltransferase
MKTLQTPRLILRAFTLDDVAAFYRMGSQPEIIRWAQPTPFASLEEARHKLQEWPLHDYERVGYGRMACVWKATGEVIGFSGLKFLPDLRETELGYRLFPEFWGQGIASEAGQACLGFARELGLGHIVSLIHPANAASIGVARKLGLSHFDDIDWGGLDVPRVHRFRLDFTNS